MRFIAKGKAIDGLPMPPAQALGAYRATFEIFASGSEPRITQVYPHADERATTLLVEVDSADELGELLSSLPGYFLSTWEVHPVASVERTLQVIGSMAASFDG